jgi:hypothetical protein
MDISVDQFTDEQIIAGVTRSFAELALTQMRKREEQKIRETIEMIKWLNPDGRIKVPAKPTAVVDTD